jgi:hypothetical protein
MICCEKGKQELAAKARGRRTQRPMVYVEVFGLELGSCGDAVVLRAELVYEGGAGSKCDDAALDWKPDAKAAAAAKAAVGGTKMWKSAFKGTVHAGVADEGGPGSPVGFLRRRKAAMAVLARHGVAGSLKNSWDSGMDSGGTVAWAGARIKADPTGLTLKKLVEALRGTVEEDNEGERGEGEEGEGG